MAVKSKENRVQGLKDLHFIHMYILKILSINTDECFHQHGTTDIEYTCFVREFQTYKDDKSNFFLKFSVIQLSIAL